jgi:hypothetical protein
MKSGTIVGVLLAANGAFAWWYISGNRERVPPWLASRKGKFLCLAAIVCGIFLIIADALV